MSADKAREELADAVGHAIYGVPHGSVDAIVSTIADAILAAGYRKVTEDAETVGLVTKVIADVDLNGDGVPGYEELAVAAIRALRGELS